MHPDEPDSPSNKIAATLSGFSNFKTRSKFAKESSPHSSMVSEFQGHRYAYGFSTCTTFGIA